MVRLVSIECVSTIDLWLVLVSIECVSTIDLWLDSYQQSEAKIFVTNVTNYVIMYHRSIGYTRIKSCKYHRSFTNK